MTITCCLHSALLVTDLAISEVFYSDILGLNKSAKRAFNFPGIWYQIGSFQLHLIVDTNFQYRPNNQEKWGRNHHLALGVTNLNTIKQKLEKAGYPIQMSASGRKALFTQDPDGNIIELSQENK